MSITGDVKKKIVLSLLNTFAKTGAFIKQLNSGYQNETGEKLAASKHEAEEYMNTLSEVYMEGDRYYSCSEKSKHIKKLVAEQNTKISPNYRGQMARNFQSFNTSFPGRQPISYKNDYVDVNVQCPTIRAGKIGNRRKTCGGPSYSVSSSSETEPRKRRAITPERATKRHRSRSKSPPRRSERSPPRRHRSRSRSRSPRRSGRSISPRYSPPRRRHKHYSVDRSPPRDRRSNSPRNKRSLSPQDRRSSRSPIRTRSSRLSKSPVRWPDQTNARSSATNGAENSNSKDDIKPSETKPAQTNNIKLEIKPKKFKFTVIGDGYIYYMLSDMQSDVKFNLSMCNHTLTLADALKMVEVQQKTLQKKKRKVMIAIGVTDLRNGRSFCDMKRDFTTLFMRCDELGLKPLITTVICFDSPELKTKADIFNKFLIECFENVVVMRDVMKIGLADVMTSMNKKNAMKLNRNSLGLGTRQQLILNVPKE